MVLDGDQLLDVPYVGDRLRKQNEGTPSARGKGESVTVLPSYEILLSVTPLGTSHHHLGVFHILYRAYQKHRRFENISHIGHIVDRTF